MWLLPSRGRPALAARWFTVGRPRWPGCLMIDKDEAAGYGPAFNALPANWVVHVATRVSLSAKLNAALALFPEAPWYGITNDDVTCDTVGWEEALLARWQDGALIAFGNDGANERISTAIFHGPLMRSIGWLAPPSLRHFYIDDAHELIAQHVKIAYLPDVMLTHRHFSTGQADYDDTYAQRGDPEVDRKAFQTWRELEWPTLLERLRASGLAT